MAAARLPDGRRRRTDSSACSRMASAGVGGYGTHNASDRPAVTRAVSYAPRVAGRRRALITGIDGQDGSYLAESLVADGYDVTGMVREADARDAPGLAAVRSQLDFVTGDLLDRDSLRRAVEQARPDELYHLAAPTFVPASWEDPSETLSAIATATATLLAAARACNETVRVWVSTSSEVFGDAGESPQHERSPDAPAHALRRREARGSRPRRRHARAPRAVRLLGHHLQPRVAAPPAALRLAQGHARRGGDQARARERTRARRPVRDPGLVARRRRHACGPPRACPRGARRLCRRERNGADGRGPRRRCVCPCGPRPQRVRSCGLGPRPRAGGDTPGGRPLPREDGPRLAAAVVVRGARRPDGRRGPRRRCARRRLARGAGPLPDSR